MKPENSLYNTLLSDTIKNLPFNDHTESLSDFSMCTKLIYINANSRITSKLKVQKAGGSAYTLYRRTNHSKDGINPGRKMLEKVKRYYNRKTWGGMYKSYRTYPNKDIDRKALDDLLTELNDNHRNAM